MSESSEPNPVYKGSCHCGFFAYTCALSLSKPNPELKGAIITKCNCSICHKTGAPLAPPDKGSFKIITPPEGRAALSEYVFNSKRMHHWFCPKCGIKPFIEGSFDHGGKEFQFQRVNILTLDGREDGKPMEELKNIKIKYFAGKYDEWGRGLADEPYEGGTW